MAKGQNKRKKGRLNYSEICTVRKKGGREMREKEKKKKGNKRENKKIFGGQREK